MVDNCSSDSSREIIDDYANKYDNFISIHHQIGSGSAGKPRNTGLSHATGDYVMFLDSDDSYTPKACETLYDKIKDIDGDIVFGRYERVYTYSGKVKKSYSPYKDKLNDLKENNPLNIPDFLWNIIKIFLYGKNIKGKYPRSNVVNEIEIESINEEPDIFKMSPAIWSKIYKHEFLIKEDITFSNLVGEDYLFSVETLLKAKKICFLNNFISYDYTVHDNPKDSSIMNNINLRLLKDFMDLFTQTSILCEKYNFKHSNILINPHLLHWFRLWLKSDMGKNENKELIKSLKNLQNRYHKSNFTLSLIIFMIKLSIII